MELYWKTAAAAMLAVVMILMLGRQDMGMLLALAVCAMVAIAAVDYLEPVRELLETLERMGNLDGDMIRILLKAVGIGLLTEISALVCADSGKASLGKMLQLLGTAAVLWMSIPLFTALLELIQEILNWL